MSIMPCDPFEDLGGLRRSMDRMLDELLLRTPRRAVPPKEWEPPIEMFETAAEVIVRAELPNVDPKTLDIIVTEDMLTLKGETKREEEQTERNYFYRELVCGAFARTLKVPTPVKGSEAKAVYKDGVLEVKIPKAEHVKPVQVKVLTLA